MSKPIRVEIIDEIVVLNGTEYVIQVPEGFKVKEKIILPAQTKVAIGKDQFSEKLRIYVHKDFQDHIFEPIWGSL